METRKAGEGCQGCIHYRRFTSYVTWKACNYFYDTGELRNCEGGKDCLCYSTDKTELKKILRKEKENECFA